MRVVKLFGYQKNQEPRVWWYFRNYGAERRPGAWPDYAKIWIHLNGFPWIDNCIGICWALFSRRCDFSLELRDTAVGDDAIEITIALPYLITLYLSLSRAKWVERLPGVDFKVDKWGTGEREIGIRIYNWAIWWRFWTSPNNWQRWWREGTFHVDDFFLGDAEYSESERRKYAVFLTMPEGYYPVTVELYEATWKRPLWPFPKVVGRANVIVDGGIPIPGKGESSHDMDDDAVLEHTTHADSVENALISLRESVFRSRKNYGGLDWFPDGGWPDHCFRYQEEKQ